MSKSSLGVDDFFDLVSKPNDFLFVDKTLFIQELIETGLKVSLIIRPRRWGKTLNMSMLRYFFAPDVEGRSTQGLFDQLNIAKTKEGAYLKYQGQHPVILISFKNIKQDSWNLFFRKISDLFASLYEEYETIFLTSDKLSQRQKTIYQSILNHTTHDQSQLENALLFLSECLEKHYGQKVMILIDEYDTPLNAAYHYGYFDKAVNFFKNLLGAALKGNPALEKGILTGILRLSKNSMLSDINNLKVYSLMDDQYSQFFGFSEDEVKMLFAQSGVSLDLPAVQKWYNGYRSGHLLNLYNPWSVLNCIDDKGALKDYWIKTGDEAILNTIFMESGPAIKEKLNQLIAGGTIESVIDDYVSFDQMKSGREQVLWSLLWALGYLKVVGEPAQLGSLRRYPLQIPNHEVGTSYRNVFIEFMSSLKKPDQYQNCLSHLTAGEVELFAQELRVFMLQNVSYFDCSNESNYHMLLLGMSAYLTETHEVLSNREQGKGRPDLVLMPIDTQNGLGIILEFKRAETGKTADQYQQLAAVGLTQIQQNNYDAHLKSKAHIQRILKMCMVFYGKDFVYQYCMDASQGQE